MTATIVRREQSGAPHSRTFIWIICLIVILIAAVPGTARADKAEDALRDALNQLQQGDNRAALEDLEEAYHQVWLKTDFHLTEMTLARARPSDFGIYDRRADNAYRLGDTVYIYYEVAAFKYRPNAQGLEFGIEMDVEMRDTAGRAVLQVSRVLSRVFQANRAVKEMYLSLSIDLESDLAGPYIVKTIMRDQVSGEETTGTLEIIVRGESG